MHEPGARTPIRSAPLSVLLLNPPTGVGLPPLLTAWCDKLDRLGTDYEVLLAVPKASPEADPDEGALTARFPRLRLLPAPERTGSGPTLQAGITAACHPLFFYTDCTHGFPPADLGLLLEHIDGADLVSGYRTLGPTPGWLRALGAVGRAAARVVFGVELAPSPAWLGWKGMGYRAFVRLVFGVRLRDPDSPFRLLRRAICDRTPVQSRGPFAHVELAAKANFLGCLLDEVLLRSRPTADAPPPVPSSRRQALADMQRVYSHPDFGPPSGREIPEVSRTSGIHHRAMIHDHEIQWMLRQRPLVHDPEQLAVDYGEEAEQMLAGFRAKKREALLPLLAWPGIATRWQTFLAWLDSTPGGTTELVPVFTAFARHLGRLTAYRALALTENEYAAIQRQDSILPSGRLKTDAVTLAGYLRKEGIRKVLYTRMCNIGAFPYDPSLSLHDHPETAVCIAEGYMLPPERLIYRMELDVPVIELVGWRMCDVGGSEHWFAHRGIWFDTTNPRTERFVLDEIPCFSLRCKSVRLFATHEEVQEYLRPFAQEQERLRHLSPLRSLD